MYAGMTDIAALTGDADYAAAARALWENVVNKKLALTGGVGARHDGEAFGDNYELPNLTAYNETCAAQANILWNQRMFLLTGESKYIDVLERSLYNGFLSGVGMDGRSFYYVNPLACDGEYPFNRETSMSRQPWYKTSCCPTNVVRLLPSLSGYVYAAGNGFAVCQSFHRRATQNLQVGRRDRRRQSASRRTTPGTARLQLELTVAQPADFTLRLRVPAFAQGRPLPGDLYRYVYQRATECKLLVEGAEVPLLNPQWLCRAKANVAGYDAD